MYGKAKHNRGLTGAFENILLLAVMLLIWILVDQTNQVNRVLLPSIQDIAAAFAEKIMDSSLLIAVGVSMGRVMAGYFLAVAAGTLLGILAGLSDCIYRMIKLPIQIFKPIPPIAWIPLVILWMGIGEGSKVFLIFLGGFFVVLLNTIDGIRSIDPKLKEVAAAVETPYFKYTAQVMIPAALPHIFTGWKVALGTCWSCVVAAELVAASSGVGYMISTARNFGQMDVVIAGMFSIGLIGKTMDEILKCVEKKVLYWNL